MVIPIFLVKNASGIVQRDNTYQHAELWIVDVVQLSAAHFAIVIEPVAAPAIRIGVHQSGIEVQEPA